MAVDKTFSLGVLERVMYILDARVSAPARGVWGHAPPGNFFDFRPSEIVSEALFEVRTAPWRNQHAPCSLAEPRNAFPRRRGSARLAPCVQRMLTEKWLSGENRTNRTAGYGPAKTSYKLRCFEHSV